MTNIEPFIINLKNKVESEFNVPVVVLESVPSAIDEGVIFIVTPTENEIDVKPYISTNCKMSFPIHIYEVVHVQNVARQNDIQANIITTQFKADSTLHKIFGRINSSRNIAGVNIVDMDFGTTSWVVDTKIYTAYRISANCVTMINN